MSSSAVRDLRGVELTWLVAWNLLGWQASSVVIRDSGSASSRRGRSDCFWRIPDEFFSRSFLGQVAVAVGCQSCLRMVREGKKLVRPKDRWGAILFARCCISIDEESKTAFRRSAGCQCRCGALSPCWGMAACFSNRDVVMDMALN